jgi:hypothetical protein
MRKLLSSTHELALEGRQLINLAPTTSESASFSSVVRSMTPSSSGRKYVAKRLVSNADKTLDLDADWRSGRSIWRLEPDIGLHESLVSAVTERPLISIQNIQFS